MISTWQGYRLKHLVRAVVEKASSLHDEGPYVGLEAIAPWTGGIDTKQNEYSGESLGNRFQRGDVLFGKLRPYLAKVALADFSGHCSGEALVLRPSAKIEARFLRYRMVEIGTIDAINASTYGAKMPRASWDFVGSMVFNIPDLEAQKSIADFLDQETVRIDRLIERKHQFISLAAERWRSTLDHIIFPNSPNWECLPFGWRKVRLKYLTDPKRPIMYGIVLPGPNMEEGPIIVKGGDVKPGRLRPDNLCRTTPEIEAGYARSRLKAGDLVISIRGGIGDIEIVPSEINGANLTQDAARIAPRSDLDREWLRYALLSSAVFHPLEARSLGAAVRGINIFDLKRVFVPEPPRPLQAEIAERLKLHEVKLAQLRGKVELHAERLREFRAALITSAVTGQIDVTEWRKHERTERRLDQIEEVMRA